VSTETGQLHFQVLCLLIGDALRNIRLMANVDQFRYLTYLEKSIELSDAYEGIHRYPIRWFAQQQAQDYLQKLRETPMRLKVRLFIIDEHFLPEMMEDLKNRELLALYWQLTGSVVSYWISKHDLESLGLKAVDDCALYDRLLLIRYDSERRVLGFEVGSDGEIEDAVALFSRVLQQHTRNSDTPFHMIPTPHGSESAGDASSAFRKPA
jgi:hypothetical protein